MTNNNRADMASEAVNVYANNHPDYQDRGAEDYHNILVDLMTDLRHFSHREGIDFEGAVMMSEINFEEEK